MKVSDKLALWLNLKKRFLVGAQVHLPKTIDYIPPVIDLTAQFGQPNYIFAAMVLGSSRLARRKIFELMITAPYVQHVKNHGGNQIMGQLQPLLYGNKDTLDKDRVSKLLVLLKFYQQDVSEYTVPVVRSKEGIIEPDLSDSDNNEYESLLFYVLSTQGKAISDYMSDFENSRWNVGTELFHRNIKSLFKRAVIDFFLNNQLFITEESLVESSIEKEIYAGGLEGFIEIIGQEEYEEWLPALEEAIGNKMSIFSSDQTIIPNESQRAIESFMWKMRAFLELKKPLAQSR